MRTRVKICCISSPEEARLAIACGADALGLVGDMPSGPGIIDDRLAREIAATVPPPVASFLLTSRDRAADIVDHVRQCGVNAVQIVRHVDPAVYPAISRMLPDIRRVQVIHVEDDSALALMDAYLPHVHAFLLDSGRPGEAVAELGGTGRTHNWSVSARFVQAGSRPVFLAGGLTPHNVGAAIREVQPYGLDLCSGVRSSGVLDGAKLTAFFAAVRSGDAARAAARAASADATGSDQALTPAGTGER